MFNDHLTDNSQKALNLTDNWHLYPPSRPSSKTISNLDWPWLAARPGPRAHAIVDSGGNSTILFSFGGGAYVSPSKVSLLVCAFSHTG